MAYVGWNFKKLFYLNNSFNIINKYLTYFFKQNNSEYLNRLVANRFPQYIKSNIRIFYDITTQFSE